MALASMAYTKEELEAKKKQYTEAQPVEDMEKYPWGLSICLSDDILKKLGLAVPAVGTQLKIEAIAKVTGSRTNEQLDGDQNASVDIQITAMDIKPADSVSDDRAERMYGKDAA